MIVLDDPRLRSVSIENLQLIFGKAYWWPTTIDSNLYRPLTTLSYFFNYAVLGNATSAAGYHAINLLLHGANALLVYALAVGISRRTLPAFLVAALWAVHPLSTEAVTNIVGRADVLSTFGVLLGLVAWTRIDVRGASAVSGGPWLPIAMAGSAIAVFSKESGVALLALVVLYDLTLRATPLPWKSLVWKWALLALPLVAFLYLRSSVVPPFSPPEPFVDNPIAGAGFWTGRATALVVLGRYLWLTFWPVTLSSDYSYAQIPLASGTAVEWMAWVTIAIAAGISAAVIAIGLPRRIRRLRGLEKESSLWIPEWPMMWTAAAGLATIALLPASNLLFPTGTIMAERLMYLPLVGIAACVVMIAARAIPSQKAMAAAICVAVTLLAVRSWVRNSDWKTEVSLWTSAVRSSPRSFKAHQGMADALYESDPAHASLDRVIEESDKSIAILDTLPTELPSGPFPSYPYRRGAAYHLELGDRLRSANSVPAAESAYKRSHLLAARYVQILERAKDAVQLESSEPQRDPDLAAAYLLLSNANSRLGQHDAAIAVALKAHDVEPLNAMPYRVIAAALIDAGRVSEAAEWLLTGFTVAGDAELRQATIDLYANGGDPRGCAIRNTANGPALDPSCETVHRDLCASTRRSIDILSRANRGDLVAQLRTLSAQTYGCNR